MEPIRVLIVDDSSATRTLLDGALRTDPRIVVVGAVANGQLALLALRSQKPDVVILDLEMPVMNGMEVLAEIRRTDARLPVIVFSSTSSHAAETTLDALWAGASDYVMKPRTRSPGLAREVVAAELLPRIEALVTRERRRATGATPRVRTGPPSPAARPPEPVPTRIGESRARVVVVAASTGGPRAIAELLSRLPGDLSSPVLITQHLPAAFTGPFAAGLQSQCTLQVSEARPGVRPGPGQVWIAPGDHHLTLKFSEQSIRLHLDQGPRENGCRPAADPLFRSAAETYGSNALAVVLTGMGQDGSIGARAIRERGGTVIAQDEASSVIWGMPGSVVRAGHADRVLALDEIADEIVSRCQGGRRHAA